MIDNRSEKILLMARVASGRQSLELPCRRILVTFFALHQGMSAHQRKSILVILNGLDGNLPALDRVATFALGAKLPAMNVGMAIRAGLAYILEDQACMALRAADLRMHPAQRIPRGVVIELHDCPSWFPASVGMAVLTWKGHGAMRIGDLGMWSSESLRTFLWLLRKQTRKQRKKCNANDPNAALQIHNLHLQFNSNASTRVVTDSRLRQYEIDSTGP